MPRIDTILDAMAGAKIFSVIDAFSGKHQVKVKEVDVEKTAFGYRKGAFEFIKMPFGLVNGPATFQRIIDELFRDQNYKILIVYLDDIVLF